MTAAAIPDVALVLKREDERQCRRAGDDPLPPDTIDTLAAAVRKQIVDPLLAQTPSSGDHEGLRADNFRLAEQAETLRREVNELGEKVTAAARERDDAQAETRRVQRALDKVRAEVVSFKAERDALQNRLQEVEVDLQAAHKALDEQAADNVEPHRHLWEVPEPNAEPQPCSCGLEYPRLHVADASRDLPTPRPEPWAHIIDRLRVELADWPERGGRRHAS